MNSTMEALPGRVPFSNRIAVKQRLRAFAKSGFLRVHMMLLRLGVIVLPRHYYVSFPDLRQLAKTRDVWARRSELHGVAVDLDSQVAILDRLVKPFQAEYRFNRAFDFATAKAFGPGFGYIEAQALHGFLRSTQPKQIIEVGSGVSTYCMMHANKLNAADGHSAAITCIEPNPSQWLKNAGVSLIPDRVERVDRRVFDRLEAGDLLFVDSTHTVRTGSDVLALVLEILPRLRVGVFVHFHDIYLPFDFQRDAEISLYQWMETALLHAYLINNSRAEILFCLSHLHYDRPDALKAIFPEYRRRSDANGLDLRSDMDAHFPSSIYLRT